MSNYEQLTNLLKLKESGVLTEQEFAIEKAKILAQSETSDFPIKNRENNSETIGYILLLLPIISSIAILSMNGLSLINYFNFFTWGTVILTSILAAIEASNLGMGKKKGENGPVGIFFGMFFLWIIVFPYYFHLRKKSGLKINFVIAIISAIIFGICSLAGYAAIKDIEEQVRNFYNY